MYKILSSIVTFQMFHNIDANKLIPNKRIIPNASNTYSTIIQLIINKIVMDNVKLKQQNVSVACNNSQNIWDSI